MRLFTPVSEQEASDLIGGLREGGPLHWQTAVVRDEAALDAVWVMVDVSENRIAAFEQHYEASPGYREFRLAPDQLVDAPVFPAPVPID